MLQQSQVGYSVPVQYGAPVGAAHRLCAGCGEEGDGRLRLPPWFPVEVVTDVGVTSEMEADWRGLVGYLVKCLIHDVLKLTVRELDTPRITEELSTLNSQN